jgi:hypothetical protein
MAGDGDRRVIGVGERGVDRSAMVFHWLQFKQMPEATLAIFGHGGRWLLRVALG